MRREVSWWIRVCVAVVWRAPGPLLVLLALVWMTLPASLVTVPAVLAGIAGIRAYMTFRPASWSRISGLVRGRVMRWTIKRRWADTCKQCGLGQFGTPRMLRTRVDWPHVQLRVRPVLGQTTTDFESCAEAVRVGVGASRLRVTPHGIRDVDLTLTVGDELRAPFDATPSSCAGSLDGVVVGRQENGTPWRLAIGPHTLVAGCSGSGKGSVFWSFAFGLAAEVRDGRVQLHGVDLKGGMEIRMGDALFTTTATNAAEAVAALEMLVGWMQDRTRRYAGKLRTHLPTADEPLHVVMIDELAALTAYCPERELQRRAETAINMLCSQGRAPGFMVFACLQDPRKEVIPARGLFTQMVGLRLKDLSETSMVLGEVAVLTGAHCHRITRDVPGTGYVLPEDGSHPIRVRAGYACDEAIAAVANTFATPTKVGVVVPAALVERSEARGRRTGAAR
jgi:S-DNA-T family DNA segregation ATPase FtsK/SpoIIIE